MIASIPDLQIYASGLSRTADFTAAARGGHGVAVVAGELSRRAVIALAEVVTDYRCPLFVDSGAYGAFRARRLDRLDFGGVLDAYDRPLEAIETTNAAEEPLPAPLLVMPDKPGDQQGTLALLRAHRGYLEALLRFPRVARPIVVLHEGRLPLSRAYRAVVDLLGREDFIVGIPSAAAATSPNAMTELFAQSRPMNVHLLGAASPRRVAPRLRQLKDGGGEPAWISADANLLRSRVLRLGGIGDGRAQAIADVLGHAARLRELDDYVHGLGGEAGLRAVFRSADLDRKRRLVGLVADLSGCSERDALKRLTAETWPAAA